MEITKDDITIEEVKNVNISLYPDLDKEKLTLIWNTGGKNEVVVDNNPIQINTNCILFISEFHMKIDMSLSSARIIKFKKTLLSPTDTLKHVGEYLMLFYGAHSINSIPKITLRNTEVETFDRIWLDLKGEALNIKNPVSEALLRNSFSRLLLLSEKSHMETAFDIPMDFKELKKIREFQYLVNQNFKELTKVSDYAKLLDVSVKKISELFGCCYDKKASELIADRRNLYAKRQLIFTTQLIKNIAYDLNFSDSQTFSHFFKKQNGVTPDDYRKQHES